MGLILVFSMVFFVVITNGLYSRSMSEENQLYLDFHNYYRTRLNPPPVSDLPKMTWNNTLEKIASVWAERCNYEHSPESLVEEVTGVKGWVGENLWMGTIDRIDPKKAVHAWYIEVNDYDYCDNTCKPGRVCGHYTQVVWARSTSVGCAKQTCFKGSAINRDFGVCMYYPGGNYNGLHPYNIADFDAYCKGKDGKKEDDSISLNSEMFDGKNDVMMDDDPNILKSISSKLEKPCHFSFTCFIFTFVQLMTSF